MATTWLHHTDGRPDLELPGDAPSPVLGRGVGIIDADGGRWRVADVWFVLEGHGELPAGWHISVEPESELGTLVHSPREQAL